MLRLCFASGRGGIHHIIGAAVDTATAVVVDAAIADGDGRGWCNSATAIVVDAAIADGDRRG